MREHTPSSELLPLVELLCVLLEGSDPLIGL
jgi:hypothetical protein